MNRILRAVRKWAVQRFNDPGCDAGMSTAE